MSEDEKSDDESDIREVVYMDYEEGEEESAVMRVDYC